MGPYIHIDENDVRKSYLAHIPRLGVWSRTNIYRGTHKTEHMKANRTISLKPEQAAWLKEHKDVNFSKLCQRWLSAYILAYEGEGQ